MPLTANTIIAILSPLLYELVGDWLTPLLIGY
jgi:hypothetical protein